MAGWLIDAIEVLAVCGRAVCVVELCVCVSSLCVLALCVSDPFVWLSFLWCVCVVGRHGCVCRAE